MFLQLHKTATTLFFIPLSLLTGICASSSCQASENNKNDHIHVNHHDHEIFPPSDPASKKDSAYNQTKKEIQNKLVERLASDNNRRLTVHQQKAKNVTVTVY